MSDQSRINILREFLKEAEAHEEKIQINYGLAQAAVKYLLEQIAAHSK